MIGNTGSIKWRPATGLFVSQPKEVINPLDFLNVAKFTKKLSLLFYKLVPVQVKLQGKEVVSGNTMDCFVSQSILTTDMT
jgi:hypothetical protein